MPSAETLRQKLKLHHWHAVLAVAFLPPDKRAGVIGSYRKRVSALSQGADLPRLEATPAEQSLIRQFLEEEDFLDDATQNGAVEIEDLYQVARGVTLTGPEVVSEITTRALRTVAFRLGHAPSAVAYDDTIRQLEHERQRAGLPPLGFPGSQTIILHLGSWAKSLTEAGPDAPPPHTRPKGQPTLLVLDECVDSWGILPGWDGFREWCNHCQISVAYHRGTWVELVEQLPITKGTSIS